MILLLGGSGYVGQAYRRFLTAKNIAFCVADRAKFNYLNREGLRALIKDVRPEFIINAAGYTGKPNVDACELHKTECLNGNAVFPGFLMESCAETGTPWGHVSSGCIFIGNRPDGSGFTEEDEPNFSLRQKNCSFYSGTKALGEEILQDAQKCYIWRLRVPFDNVDNSRNYLTKVMSYSRLLDVRNSLSQLDEFIGATWECWSRRIPFGIYNVTNPGSVTTREVVELVKASALGGRLKAQGKVFSFFSSEEEFMKIAAKAPRSHCVLNSGKLAQQGIKMTEVHEAVDQALRSWKTNS
jgi:dTDP-4-dehydrorhamnose reductase